MSPLAKPAFKLCVVGDTGLKTGLVRCRHGAGWDEAGGYHGTNVALSLGMPGLCTVSNQNNLQLHSPNRMCVWPRALEFPTHQVRSVEATRRIRVESWSNVMT